MKRYVFTSLVALWLLLCVAISAMWIRSYWVNDWGPKYLRGSSVVVHSWWGRVFITWVKMPTIPVGADVSLCTPTPQVGTHRPDTTIIEKHFRSGRGWMRLPLISAPPSQISNGFGFGRWVLILTGGPLTIYYLSLPYWAVWLVVTLSFPCHCLLIHLRTGRRVRLGLCLHCGYDLRASEGRCPECGTAVPSNDGEKAAHAELGTE